MTVSRVLGDRLHRLARSFPVVAVTGPQGQLSTEISLRGLKRFAEFAGEDSHHPALIYGGEGGMTWHGVQVMGWKEAGGVI